MKEIKKNNRQEFTPAEWNPENQHLPNSKGKVNRPSTLSGTPPADKRKHAAALSGLFSLKLCSFTK